MSRPTPRTPHRWTDADDATLERAVGTLAARGLPPRVDLWSAICGLLAAEGLIVTPSAAATRYHRIVERRREEEAERLRRASEDTLIGSLTSTLPGGECPCGTGLWSPPEPTIGQDGIGICPEDEQCRHYDGKRCRLMGFRPSRICEPWVLGLLRDQDAAWRATRSGARGLATLAEVIATMRERLIGVEAELAKCHHCGGAGRMHIGCRYCGDSTYDHECDDHDIDCPYCRGTGRHP